MEPFLNVTSFVLLLGITITAVNIYQLRKLLQESTTDRHNLGGEPHIKNFEPFIADKLAWIHGKQVESGYLEHVFAVFRRLGYTVTSKSPFLDWQVLWTHEYPFSELSSNLAHLKPFQKVNHFPGCGYITNKVSLSTSSLKHIPKAFKLPADKEIFLEHASLHPSKVWVQKSNSHRGIKVETIDSLNLDSEGTFVQEFVHNPLLIDGRKFDIGIYTILTSIDPLRVYIYDGDALFRFCEEMYHPFNESNVDSYVVGDDYLPIWKVQSLEKYFNFQSQSMKETLNSFLFSQGKNPNKIWSQIKEAIASVYEEKEELLIKSANRFASTRNFFEMVRFDFVVDEELNVYLLEANMSPNLSSAHFRQNKFLYEQVIYNLLSVVGLAMVSNPWSFSESSSEFQMEVSDRDIAVFGEICSGDLCSTCQGYQICKLCHHCITSVQKNILKSAFIEHANRRSCRRIVPKPFSHSNAQELVERRKETLSSSANDLLTLWFAGKCLQDISWCN